MLSLLDRAIVAACVCLLAGCAPTGFKITPVPTDRTLKELELERDPGWVTSKIALIDVDGVIMNRSSGGLFSEGEHPVSLLVEMLGNPLAGRGAQRGTQAGVSGELRQRIDQTLLVTRVDQHSSLADQR